jgi:septum formation protein
MISGFSEDIDKTICRNPTIYVTRTARQKAEAVCNMIQASGKSVDLVIAADTIVVYKDSILEKPVDKTAAIHMLKMLSGNVHEVLTAVTIASKQSSSSSSSDGYYYNYHDFVETTTVKFDTLTDEVICEYVDTGEPMDKAGGYGIQSLGASLVEGINGCYFNVVGFPVHRFCTELSIILESWNSEIH